MYFLLSSQNSHLCSASVAADVVVVVVPVVPMKNVFVEGIVIYDEVSVSIQNTVKIQAII